MSGDVLTCPAPRSVSERFPALAQGTYWRCDCGVVWRAKKHKWAVVGLFRTHRGAARSHLEWLVHLENLSHMTPQDRAWLERNR